MFVLDNVKDLPKNEQEDVYTFILEILKFFEYCTKSLLFQIKISIKRICMKCANIIQHEALPELSITVYIPSEVKQVDFDSIFVAQTCTFTQRNFATLFRQYFVTLFPDSIFASNIP